MNQERLIRNHPALTEEEQRRLADSRVCIVGCGGLGGYLAENLARAGVGALTLVDGDTFEVSNLNRQRFATEKTVGASKALTAAEWVRELDPSVSVRAEQVFLTEENGAELLKDADLVMDGLDGAASRRVLASACRSLGLPLIHGAIQGWNAQISVCMPGSSTLDQLYKDAGKPTDKSCLSFTPALCAAIQCAEAVKLLTGRETALESRLLLADLRYMDFMTVDL